MSTTDKIRAIGWMFFYGGVLIMLVNWRVGLIVVAIGFLTKHPELWYHK